MLRALPSLVQKQARTRFHLLLRQPERTDIQPMFFDRDLYRISIGLFYRAVGVKTGNAFLWTFIGSHEDYNRIARKPVR